VEQKKRRQYTPADREAVLGDVGELGVLGAARKHGVQQSCVSRWASAARMGRGGGEQNGGQPVEVVPAPDEPMGCAIRADVERGAGGEGGALE
jgi:transposase-like protein